MWVPITFTSVPAICTLAWIGANHDTLNLVNTPDQVFPNNGIGNQFEQTFDIRYKDIDIGFGKLSFIALSATTLMVGRIPERTVT